MYTIMIIDDNETELLVAKKALEKQYRIIDKDNAKAALQLLAKTTMMPDFILLDVAMPGINGFDFIMRLKTNEKMKNIPVIFLSGDKDTSTEMEAYRLGAVDFIRKPIIPDLLRKRLELQVNVLEYKSQMNSYNSQLQQAASFQARNAMNLEYFIIGIITDLISQKDPYTGMHTICVSKYMEILLKEMLLSGVNSESQRSIAKSFGIPVEVLPLMPSPGHSPVRFCRFLNGLIRGCRRDLFRLFLPAGPGHVHMDDILLAGQRERNGFPQCFRFGVRPGRSGNLPVIVIRHIGAQQFPQFQVLIVKIPAVGQRVHSRLADRYVHSPHTGPVGFIFRIRLNPGVPVVPAGPGNSHLIR